MTATNTAFAAACAAEAAAEALAAADTRTPDPALVQSLAVAFAAQLLADVGAAALADIVAANEADGSDLDGAFCHSHDHVDANMTMYAAYGAVVGSDCRSASPHDTDLWNAAWTLAKQQRFYTRK